MNKEDTTGTGMRPSLIGAYRVRHAIPKHQQAVGSGTEWYMGVEGTVILVLLNAEVIGVVTGRIWSGPLHRPASDKERRNITHTWFELIEIVKHPFLCHATTSGQDGMGALPTGRE